MRKIAKSTQEKFNKGIFKMMETLGATQLEHDSWRLGKWELESQGGKIVFSLPSDHTYCFTLFGKFQDVDKANEVLTKDFGHNIFSGKYNFHLSAVPAKQLHEIFDFITWRITSIKL